MDPALSMTIAGSDSGGGAGLQADLKTFAALGVFGTSVVTALTAQNSAEVRGVLVVDPAFVELQIDAVLSDLPVASVKTGMLASSATVAAVARWAAEGRLPNLVVDPVLVASTGRPLLDEGAVASYLELLLPHALVVTPNMREAAILADMPVTDVDGMVRAARRLADTGVGAVVVKGGHLAGRRAPDIVLLEGAVHVLDGPRVTSRNDHGTGCTLSAATAGLLALGTDLLDALARAKEFVSVALRGSATWRLGAGHGPLDHFGWGAGTGSAR
ncbi:MAG TPA: bifunctional hydroxymethylpyrimidine kinase/phosphomethylpyrimidine kinase [Acidimicrobiales bacterium]|nr:bifunctional hydroxymethylpyrimidine kinase/phosphomethylpyrimidine kinase [Acidimicrobiales bacterium]